MVRIALAQFDFLVGDVPGNLERVLMGVREAREAGADLVLFPELCLTGYPPEDLLLRPGFLRATHAAVAAVQEQARDIDVVVGHPWLENGLRYNAASWFRDSRLLGRYRKQRLPNYAVFDEARYFTPGTQPLVRELGGARLGVVICEDTWESGPLARARGAGA